MQPALSVYQGVSARIASQKDLHWFGFAPHGRRLPVTGGQLGGSPQQEPDSATPGQSNPLPSPRSRLQKRLSGHFVMPLQVLPDGQMPFTLIDTPNDAITLSFQYVTLSQPHTGA